MTKKVFRIVVMMILLLIVVVSLICLLKDKKDKHNNPDNDTGVIGNEELLLFSTHMADAVYLGKEKDDYVFRIEKIFKGDFGNTDVFHVDSLATPSIKNLKVGHTYFLPLYKVMTIYHDYNNFQITGEELIASEDEEWEKVHSLVDSIIREGKDSQNTCIGARFTRSNDIHEVINFAQFIFKVEIGELFSNINSESETVAYKCKVKKVLKEPYPYSGEVVITFFKNTVIQGEEYIVLVEHNEKNSIMFPLSSKEYGVLSIDTADNIQELNNMMERSDNQKSEECFIDKTLTVYLREEIDSIREQSTNSVYYDNNKECNVFFNGIVFDIEGDNKKLEDFVKEVGYYGLVMIPENGQYKIENTQYSFLLDERRNCLSIYHGIECLIELFREGQD